MSCFWRDISIELPGYRDNIPDVASGTTARCRVWCVSVSIFPAVRPGTRGNGLPGGGREGGGNEGSAHVVPSIFGTGPESGAIGTAVLPGNFPSPARSRQHSSTNSSIRHNISCVLGPCRVLAASTGCRILCWTSLLGETFSGVVGRSVRDVLSFMLLQPLFVI